MTINVGMGCVFIGSKPLMTFSKVECIWSVS